MNMTLNDVTKGAVDVAAKAVRLPLQAVTAVVKPEEGDAWAPVLVIDQAEATVRGFLGGLLHDDALTVQANLQRARITEVKHAAEARAQAEATERLAERRLSDREREVQAERAHAQERAARAKQAVEEEKARAEQRVDRSATQKKAVVNKVAEAREAGIEAQETVAERRRLEAEAVALEEQRKAVAAKGKVLRLDDSVEAIKAKRSS